MAYSFVVPLAFLVIFSLACSSTESALIERIVNTTNGPVRGEAITLNTNKSLVRFLGIPFGRVKRFEAAELQKPWSDPLNATTFGKMCPQNPNFAVKNANETAEQCLTINVFIPQESVKPKELLPVMVWIYGGSFIVGGSGAGIYNPSYLATEGGVMIVTFNYRLGVLGFLSTGTKEIPGNFGLFDQVAAFHWVQKNIDRFGGDPNKVTIFGESAGASSVALHMLSPQSYKLYNQVILQSGTAAAAASVVDNKTAIESAKALAKYLGCDMSELKACLLRKNVREILEAQKNISMPNRYQFLPNPFKPVVDNHFLHDLPFNLLVNGKFNQTVPVLMGVTKNEGSLFVLPLKGISQGIPGIDKGINKTTFDSLVKQKKNWVYNQTQKVIDAIIFEYTDWANETNPLVVRQKFIDILSDSTFKAPAMRSAEAFIKSNLSTYFYSFDHFKSPRFPSWAGVIHSGDIPYVFGEPFLKYNKSATSQNEEINFSKQVITLWSSFAKNGKPTEDAAKWPAYTLEEKQYISLKPSSSIQKNMLPDKMAFWNSFVPSLTEPKPSMAPVVPPTTNPKPVPVEPTAHKEASTASKATENALIAVVVVLALLVVILVVVVWRIRRKLGDAMSDPGPTTRLI